jgi:hypothetical protein
MLGDKSYRVQAPRDGVGLCKCAGREVILDNEGNPLWLLCQLLIWAN